MDTTGKITTLEGSAGAQALSSLAAMFLSLNASHTQTQHILSTSLDLSHTPLPL